MIAFSLDLAPSQAALNAMDLRLQALAANVVEGAGRALGANVKGAMRRPRAINVQDNPAGRHDRPRMSAIRVRSVGTETTVEIPAFWTYVRSRAMREIYARHGRAAELRRPGLWVAGRRKKGEPAPARSGKAYVNRGGLVYVALSDQRLARWAELRERGAQAWRHTLRVSGPMLADLVAAPALAKTMPVVERIITQGLSS